MTRAQPDRSSCRPADCHTFERDVRVDGAATALLAPLIIRVGLLLRVLATQLVGGRRAKFTIALADELKTFDAHRARIAAASLGTLTCGAGDGGAMSQRDPTREELLAELEAARKRVAALETATAKLERSEREVRQRAAEREAMFRAFPDLSFRLARDGTIVDFHAGRAADLYTKPEMFLGKRVQDVLPEKVGLEHLECIQRALEGDVVTLEYVLPLPEGEKVFEARFIGLADGDVYDVVRDITEHRQREAALRESERSLNEAQAIAHLGHWRFSAKTSGVTGSREFFRILGLDEQTTTLEALAAVIHRDHRERHRDQLSRALSQGEPWDSELQLRLADGTIKVVRSKGEALRDADGRVEQLVGTVQDISDRIHAEAQRRTLEARMQQAQKLESLGILAGGIAHDFNNMLSAIIGFASVALHEIPTTSPAAQRVREIADVAHQCADLANQMLAYAGKGKFVVENIDLAALVSDMNELLRSSVSKRALLTLDLHALPLIKADASQMRQLILNLVINASEAIGEREGRIKVTGRAGYHDPSRPPPSWFPAECELPTGPYLVLEVSDTGGGMDAETRARIFDPFFTTKFTGRGLGLAAVHGIVRGHHGVLTVESELEKGTTFRIALPALEASAVAAPPAPVVTDDDWTGTGTILVADDEPMLRSSLARLLQVMGFAVLVAADGRQALEIFGQHSAEVVCVILDYTMPGIDGTETVSKLREIRPDIPVLLSSGYSEVAVSERFAGLTLSGFLQKPFGLDELRQKLRAALGT